MSEDVGHSDASKMPTSDEESSLPSPAAAHTPPQEDESLPATREGRLSPNPPTRDQRQSTSHQRLPSFFATFSRKSRPADEAEAPSTSSTAQMSLPATCEGRLSPNPPTRDQRQSTSHQRLPSFFATFSRKSRPADEAEAPSTSSTAQMSLPATCEGRLSPNPPARDQRQSTSHQRLPSFFATFSRKSRPADEAEAPSTSSTAQMSLPATCEGRLSPNPSTKDQRQSTSHHRLPSFFATFSRKSRPADEAKAPSTSSTAQIESDTSPRRESVRALHTSSLAHLSPTRRSNGSPKETSKSSKSLTPELRCKPPSFAEPELQLSNLPSLDPKVFSRSVRNLPLLTDPPRSQLKRTSISEPSVDALSTPQKKIRQFSPSKEEVHSQQQTTSSSDAEQKSSGESAILKIEIFVLAPAESQGKDKKPSTSKPAVAENLPTSSQELSSSRQQSRLRSPPLSPTSQITVTDPAQNAEDHPMSPPTPREQSPQPHSPSSPRLPRIHHSPLRRSPSSLSENPSISVYGQEFSRPHLTGVEKISRGTSPIKRHQLEAGTRHPQRGSSKWLLKVPHLLRRSPSPGRQAKQQPSPQLTTKFLADTLSMVVDTLKKADQPPSSQTDERWMFEWRDTFGGYILRDSKLTRTENRKLSEPFKIRKLEEERKIDDDKVENADAVSEENTAGDSVRSNNPAEATSDANSEVEPSEDNSRGSGDDKTGPKSS